MSVINGRQFSGLLFASQRCQDHPRWDTLCRVTSAQSGLRPNLLLFWLASSFARQQSVFWWVNITCNLDSPGAPYNTAVTKLQLVTSCSPDRELCLTDPSHERQAAFAGNSLFPGG